jgi:hypothetical protein
MSTVNGGWRGPNIVKDGLVLYVDAGSPNSYPLINSSTTWKDISGNGYTGTLINGPTFNNANGGRIVIDGTNQYTKLSSTLNFSNYNTSGFTISFWIKVNSTTQINKYLFSKLTNAGSDNQFSIIYGYVANTYELYGGVGGAGANQTIRTNSQISVNDTNWHNLTYSVGTTTTGYLDSIIKFTNTYASLTYVSSTNNNYLTTFDAAGFYLNSNIATMQLYNRILSSQEILQNYNATKTRFGL